MQSKISGKIEIDLIKSKLHMKAKRNGLREKCCLSDDWGFSSDELNINYPYLFTSGRTFPTHPYFSTHLGAGQLSLFNLLKAYSLLDKEVGYCQGISFVAGVLLLHMSEEQAFEMLKFLMYDLGFRKQYRPDMMSLQVS